MLLRLILVPLAAILAMCSAVVALLLLIAMRPDVMAEIGLTFAGFFRAFVNATQTDAVAAVERSSQALVSAGRLMALVALAPTLLMALITELMGLRSWLVHIPGNAVLTLVLPLSALDPRFISGLQQHRSLAVLLLLTGCIAGSVYWLIAGRNAGRSSF